ncbi:MAG: hypothetical protein IT342_05670 [Candidatus Melainabacteria bacterium]|nr:hypothetical protein [Candidatus Melainabacteria bacterium]
MREIQTASQYRTNILKRTCRSSSGEFSEMSEKMYAVLIDPKNEKKIRNRISKILERQVNGVVHNYRQSTLHKMVGCSIRAGYFKYLLETMQEEKLIMRDNRGNWALWDAKSSVEQRECREKCKRDIERWRLQKENSPYGIAERKRREAELANEVQERFIAGLQDFFVENEDELFDAVTKFLVINHLKRRSQSAITYSISRHHI